MDIEKAKEIVKACNQHVWWTMGVVDEPPPSIYDYTLAELLEANHVVAEQNRANGGEHMMHCADRLVAALYALYHYEPTPQNDPDAICCLGDRALLCVTLR